jgi:hypothetical protein
MKLTLVTLCSILILSSGCGTNQQPAQQVTETEAPPENTSDKFDDYALGVCETRQVQVRETEPGPDDLTEKDVAAMYTEPPARLIHGNVTVGANDFEAPTAAKDSIATNANGRRLADVPAWIVVREGLRMPASGPSADSSEKAEFTAFGYILDAVSGEQLYGWSCATRVEQGGHVEETRGVDPDKQETSESGEQPADS